MSFIWVGAGAMAVGGAMGAASEKSGATKARRESEFNPYGVDTGFGSSASFHAKDGTMAYHATDGERQLLSGYGDFAINRMNEAGWQGDYVARGAFQDMAGNYDRYNRYNNAYDDQMLRQYGRSEQMSADHYRGMQDQYNSMGGIKDYALNQAQGLMNQNYGQYAQDQLNLMRDASAQQETRDTYQLRQNLFSSGRLGTEGGARNIQAFNQAQEQNDMQRQMTAQSMAMQRQQQDRATAMQLGQFGTNAANQQFNMAQGAESALNSYLQRNQGMADNVMNRASQRLANTQALMGFGQGFTGQQLGQSLQAMQGMNLIRQDGRQALSLGINAGSAASAANVKANELGMKGGANQSIFGNALEGFGSGLLGGFSDERLKENITHIGTVDGINFYSWDWNDKAKEIGADRYPSYGAIAQEVQKIMPEAVHADKETGYLRVNYDIVLGGGSAA